MSFFGSLAKAVGGVVGGAVGSFIPIPGVGTALGAALGSSIGGAIEGGGGGGGGAPAPAASSLAPSSVYHGIYSQKAGAQAALDLAARSKLAAANAQVARLKKTQADLLKYSLQGEQARRAKALALSEKPPMSTGTKAALAVGGGTVIVGGGTALYLALRR